MNGSRSVSTEPEGGGELPEAGMIPTGRAPRHPDEAGLYEASRALGSALELSAVLRLACRLAASTLRASAASLHLVDEETGELRASAGCPVEGAEIGPVDARLAEAIRTAGAPCLVADLGQAAEFASAAPPAATSALGVPLFRKGGVIGTLCAYWRLSGEPPASARGVFGEDDLQLLVTLGALVATAIENARLFAAAEQQAKELSLLREIGQAIISRLDLPTVLEAVVSGAARLIESEHTQIFLWDETSQSLRYGAALGPAAERVRNLRYELGKGVNGMVARTRQPMILDDYRASPYALPDFADVVATATTPVLFGDRLLGVLHAYSTQPGKRFRPGDLRLLQLLATQAAIAIENARLFAAEQERRWQMETIRRVTEEITRELDHPTLLSLITRRVVELVWATSGTVWLWEEAEQSLVAHAWHGLGDWMRGRRLRLGEGVAGAAAERRAGVIANDYPTSPYAVRDVLDHSAIVAVLAEPLLYRDRLLGVITVDVCDPGRMFSEGDRRTLGLFANQAAIAIENARLFRESQRLAQENVLRLRRISILHEIGMAIQGTMHLDALLQIILTGTTFGEGLGFNRALLLLLNPARNRLEGRMGVGPASGEEAARVWSALVSEARSLREVISERAARQAEEAESDFDRLARSLTVPLRPDAGILALTALEARPFHITDARHDPRVRPEYEGRLGVGEFATVPLVAKGKVVGVMAVDNMFSGKAIAAQDLEFLSVFASQAGLAVESAQVYTRLEEASREIQRSHHQLLHQERLATLGEMAAHVVHEIRNPLVSIGGFARRLAQRLAGREPEGQYAQIIAREVDRLERIVHDVQALSRDVRLSLAEVDLHELVQDCLVLFAERIATLGIRLRMDLTGRPPILLLDMVRMKQAILNLLTNALEAMPNGGTLTVLTRIFRKEEHGRLVEASTRPVGDDEGSAEADNSTDRPLDESANALAQDEWVELSMGDTGGGIPQEILGEIFEPFFTTKSAGTGLGLTLVRRIVRAHGGRIEVDNSPGKAVTFRLFLPAGGIPSEGAASA